MPFSSRFDIGNIEIIADQLDFITYFLGQELPAFPIILRHSVLDADNRIGIGPLGIKVDHLLTIESLAFFSQYVLAVLKELAGSRIQSNKAIFTRSVIGFFDGRQDGLDRLAIRFQGRSKTALISDVGVIAFGL